MTQARSHIETRKSIGDGNCAFNSAVLSLFEKEVLNKIEQNLRAHQRDPNVVFKKFIKQAAKIYKIEADWETVKTRILAEREKDSSQLQRQLAPVMRALALDLAEKDEDHYTRTINPLLSAFNNYLSGKLGLLAWSAKDDIFEMHSFITEKFLDLYQTYNPNHPLRVKAHRFLTKKSVHDAKKEDANKEEMMLDALMGWWEAEGYTQFLQAMKKPKTWAGDLELYQLGAYFGVDIDVYRHDKLLQTIHSEHGAIPLAELSELHDYLETEWLVTQLQLRNIGELSKDNEEFKLYKRTPEQLSRQLGAVPQVEKVLALINAAEEAGTPLAKVFFPVDDEAVKLELVARNVITRDSDTGKFKFAQLSYEEAKEIIKELPRKDEVLATWRHHYQDTPTLSLINNYGIHWNSGVIGVAPIKKPVTQNGFYKETLTQLQMKKITYDKAAHKSLIASAKKESASIKKGKEKEKKSTSEFFVKYKLSSGKDITVSKKTQEMLDEELAKKLQTEEYRKYKSSRKR